MNNVILCACLSFILVNGLSVHKIHRWLNRKPFACDVCMAGWLAVPYCWHQWHTPLYMAGAMVAVIALNKIFDK